MRAVVLAIALLAPWATVSADPPGEPWWLATAMDADGDGLDDALTAPRDPATPIIVLAAFSGIPSAPERAALAQAGFDVGRPYSHFDVLPVRLLPHEVPRLRAFPGVVFVEADAVLRPLLKDSVPLVGAPQVWSELGATGRGVVVAILDDGTFQQHPDLDGKVAGSYDAGVDSLGASGPAALPASTPILPAGEEGHGTHIAGIVVGNGDRSGGTYRGVAPDARFVDVKVFRGPNQTSSEVVLRGLDWTLSNAERLGIRAASMSLGGPPSDGTDALSRAVDAAVGRGLVVVAAAGNAGPGASTIGSPGAAERAITVGAVDKQKHLASYSSRGPTVDGRAKPDLVAPGTAIVSTIPPASTTSIVRLASGNPDVYYGPLSGTSMSAPHVAGVVALMLEANPALAPVDVKRILVETAQDLGAPGRDDATGAGFVNAIAATQVARDPTLLATTAVPDTSPPASDDPLWIWAVLGAAVTAGVVALGFAIRRR